MSRCNNVKGGHGVPAIPPFTRQFDLTDYTVTDTTFGSFAKPTVELREDGTVWERTEADFGFDTQIGTWYVGTIPGVLADYEVRWQQGGQDPVGPGSDSINNWVNADNGNGHGGGLITTWNQEISGGVSTADGQLQTRRVDLGGNGTQSAGILLEANSF